MKAGGRCSFAHLHVLGEVETPDVGAGDDPVPGQLPDVELVHGEDPVHLGHQLLLEAVHLDVGGHGLEEDQGGLNQQRPDRLEDQEDQEDAEARVHIVLVFPISLPHDQGRDDDDH